uniref:Uncharacterized protein n=1 Tax=Arundo donax TaxID=35708 RepID=A0A0A9AQA4_ARUDO
MSWHGSYLWIHHDLRWLTDQLMN